MAGITRVNTKIFTLQSQKSNFSAIGHHLYEFIHIMTFQREKMPLRLPHY